MVPKKKDQSTDCQQCRSKTFGYDKPHDKAKGRPFEGLTAAGSWGPGARAGNISFEDAGYDLTKRQAWDGIRMVSGESGGEGRPKSAKWKNLCNLCEVSFTKKSKPTTSIFEAEPARQTKDPHEPIKKKRPFRGAFSFILS
jgi:hypothetical protein